ncbi:ROK family protein [Phytoactinopolyspora alkaliphila]|uniref:ROK family protein n=1 Tax=Phytoactinopolyspora alkaliphila TaxID=1783498 RepID=A0A6N9YMH2_9ACTN|nr:ROK family transcriptional regulator [Phytoactinopolyspora alkaliphila]NED96226.1 ROK family protein [Phytoactinopolyspora alkaliphila]
MTAPGTVVAAGTEFMREINASAILRRLRSERSMSVAALAEAVGLSRQAVTRSLHALAAEGIVEFTAPERRTTRMGRPAQLVRFRAEAGYVLGVSIDPQHLRVALCDLAGDVVTSEHVEFPPEVAGEEALAALVAAVARVLETAGVPREDVWYASAGAPGIVDPAAGVIKLIPSMPGISGDILVRIIGDAVGCPVYLDNDVKLATQGELWRGVEHPQESLVVIHWGDRVGAGIVLKGELYRGASNDAGDIGFLDLLVGPGETAPDPAPDTDLPRPPGLGRFEEWVGAGEIVALASAAARRLGDDDLRFRLGAGGDHHVDTVIDAFTDGTPAAVAAIEVAAGRFAKGVAAIRAILDPSLIVIGGPLARCGEPLLDVIRRDLESHPLNQPALEISALGDDAVLFGALYHALAEIERAGFGRLDGKPAESAHHDHGKRSN